MLHNNKALTIAKMYIHLIIINIFFLIVWKYLWNHLKYRPIAIVNDATLPNVIRFWIDTLNVLFILISL